MRAIVVLLVLWVGAAPAAAQARSTPFGFDHIVHDGRITVLGKPSIACASCHPVTAAGALVGRPGHSVCLGACHIWTRKPGVALSDDLEQVCATCHAPADLAKPKPTVPFPPFAIEPDYPMTISHAKHAGAKCESCHGVPGAKAAPTKPHARCSGCHSGATAGAAPMSSCTSCHIAAYGANALPRLVRGPLAVGDAYLHAKHATRTPAAAVACASCHKAITTATGLELTPPTSAECATSGCHDGAAAFAITERCTACHTRAPTARMEVVQVNAPFQHDTHAPRLAIDGCSTCHSLDARGGPVTGGHRACATCHASDFAQAKPTICGACHSSIEPWRALVADHLPAPRSELGARMNHASHAKVPCTRCHTLTTATRELRPARGHVACTGSGCHERATATSAPPAAPVIDNCATCHALGLERARVGERMTAPWTVRARFRHEAHPGECTSCHDGVAGSTDAATIATPKKPACAPCHDGKRAFKMTGHGCARCHGS